METQEIKNYQVGVKHYIKFERSAVKGIDGFEVITRGDDLDIVIADAKKLYAYVINTVITSETVAIK